MNNKKIQVDKYSENWPAVFENEKKIILDAIGSRH